MNRPSPCRFTSFPFHVTLFTQELGLELARLAQLQFDQFLRRLKAREVRAGYAFAPTARTGCFLILIVAVKCRASRQ